MNALTHRSSNLFDEFFRDMSPGFFVRPLHGDALPTPSQIKVDVNESDHAYSVVAEVPGVKKEDIHVSLDGNTVTLRAEVRQDDQQGTDKKALRIERYYGAVARSFQLPQDVDAGQAEANTTTVCSRSPCPRRAAAACSAWRLIDRIGPPPVNSGGGPKRIRPTAHAPGAQISGWLLSSPGTLGLNPGGRPGSRSSFDHCPLRYGAGPRACPFCF